MHKKRKAAMNNHQRRDEALGNGKQTEHWRPSEVQNVQTDATEDVNVQFRRPHPEDGPSRRRDGEPVVDERRTVRQIWNEFLQGTTLHGCSNAVGERKSLLGRLIWTVLIIGMSLTLMGVLVSLYIEYQEYNFVTEWGLRRDTSIDVPAVTICLPSEFDSSKVKDSPELREYLKLVSSDGWTEATDRSSEDHSNQTEARDKGDHAVEYVNTGFPRLRLNATLLNVTYSALQKIGGFNTEDVFLNMRTTLLPNDEDLLVSDYFEKVSHWGGSCWTMNPWTPGSGGKTMWKMSTYDIIAFNIHVRQNFYVEGADFVGIFLFLHPPEVPYFQYSPTQISPGTRALTAYKKTEYNFLNLPYHSFGNQGCVEENEPKLKISSQYNAWNCIHEKSVGPASAKCKCIDEFFMAALSDYPVCNVFQLMTCFRPTMLEEMRRELASQENGTSTCLHKCKSSQFTTFLSTAVHPLQNNMKSIIQAGWAVDLEDARQNLISLLIQPKDTVVTTLKHVPELTRLGIFGQVGGYMGLCLGASLLTLSELIEAVLLTVWTLCSRLHTARRLISVVHGCY